MKKSLFLSILSLPLLLIVNSYCQIDSNSLQTSPPLNPSSNITGPELVISNRNTSQSIFLHNLEPSSDSCVDVEIGFSQINNVKIHLSFIDKKWNYSGITSSNNNDQAKSVIVNFVEDLNNSLIKILIVIKSIDDSIEEKRLPINILNDLKIPPDTSKMLDYSINRIASICKQARVVVNRKFTYSPDYMRRCPVYNYPELSMFHYGSSIHMPNSESIRLRGIMIFEYHQSTLPKLIYDSTITTIDKRFIIEEQRKKTEDEKAIARQNKPKKVFLKPLW